MKKNFAKYVKERNDLDLAVAILETGVDVNAWVQHVTDVVRSYELTEAQLYNELMGGLGAMAGAGMRGIGNSFRNVGSGIASGVGGAARGMGNAMGQAGQWAGKQVAPVMQGAKTAYAQGEIASVLKKVQGLRGVLIGAKVADPRQIDSFLNAVTKYLQDWSQKMNPQVQQQLNFGT